ncbi:sensor histidine kinase [Nonomuraea sp. KC401]|uniref:sensor histidine kinase n=1 Tax=unclassified Nonomuraea TaxID=2593643 RepID=UPI0010FEFF4B|nr:MULTISPECIES: sensor histidine kinase [unclassified Nonomuraea]NBE97446.1 sensor histidine kinase [Nonomuraea sp. K271]TLF79043.1 sensor histidine kinase [Nonomuraea sp. KC401]
MDPIKRARRLTWVMIGSGVLMMWVLIAVRSVEAHVEGVLSWWRAGPALLAAAGLTWFCLRMADAILDRRYPTRQVVVAAVLALVAAGAGGADPIGWGFVLTAWLSVAMLGVSTRTLVLQMAATWVVGVALALVTAPAGMFADRGFGYYALLYGLWCVILPPSGRVWLLIWRLAMEAHEGRDAHTRLALAEERLRVSRDLHATVGHQLSAIAVKTELAVRLSDKDAGAARAEMVEVNTLTRKALRELRQAVRGYRELDLDAELNSVKGVLEAAGVRCEMRLPHRELPDGVSPAFAYAVREAVTNVLKHSVATFCRITIRFTEDEAELEVRNDGVAERPGGDLGSGLAGLRERLAAAGGTVNAQPAGDGEFVLNAVVSLPIRG